ncbi:hypothetical protein [Nocardioides sp. T2.26MG-1]|uniref:hypothetical protein n=1 Tax=Nocardioides sp. T2.26MG-1 TaxID=3041166 RepID=UPI0024777F8F|nr:hypothetical protein [Nocardioides sp. T2.26MG-1]CAI9409166.1 hypothetical protein HIDPHFAB_01232 [Nocardioides sp. T2.26MG-1]
MEHIALALTRLYVALVAPRPRDERGDVPGWVMITVMTAGLVVVITGVAKTQLTGMLSSALNQVK